VDDHRDPLEERRTSAASRIVVDRDDIKRFNGSTVGDLLRQLPGVTFSGPPGNPKDIRMRGLDKGYTQIHIDGEAVATGTKERQIQVDRIPVELIERVEILRNPTAEFDPNGIGGTINIILKEEASRRTTSFRAALGSVGDKNPGQMIGSFGDRMGSFSYLLSGGVDERHEYKGKEKSTQGFTATGTRNKWEMEDEEELRRVREFSFIPSFKWKLSEKDSFIFRPFLIKSEETMEKPTLKTRYATPLTGINLVPNGSILERENKELRRANEILKLASAFFAQAELDRRLKS
jgi:iron complex outermembrane receptor protein